MNKIKRYLECYIPVTTCNLKCSYCYIAQQGKFNAQIPEFEHSAQEIRRALSQKRMGGSCLVNLCAGGETLLAEPVLAIVRQLLEEGHYVAIVTNGILTKRFEALAEMPQELLKHLFIKFSFHFLEFKRLNLFDTFFDNVHRMQRAGASFVVEMTPCDEEIPYIQEIKDICVKNVGAVCQITIGRSDVDPDHRIPHLSKYPFDEYQRIWKTFDSEMFDYKRTIFYQHRSEFCYAGDWSLYINLGTGNVWQCYRGKALANIFTDTDKPYKFEAIGRKCGQAHCYNGHAFLTLGDIPELEAPTYATIRNRKCADGTEWLQPEVKAFFDSKLCESNREYSALKKAKIQFSDDAATFARKVKGKLRHIAGK